jgi:hypothetical protein
MAPPGIAPGGAICYIDPMTAKREDHPEMSDATWDLMQLIMSEEPLHPDLVPYYQETEDIGSVLRHPLVYEIMGVRPGLANKKYEYKKKAIAKAIAEKDWYTYVFLHERPWRADALLTVRDRFGKDIEHQRWWSLVGAVWVDSENIWQNLDEWDDILNTERPHRIFMMNDEELAKYHELPEMLTVYRGSIAGLNENGLSWTLNKKAAKFFARRFVKAHERDGVIDTGEVGKVAVVAYFDGRGEDEIVVEHAESVKIIGRETVVATDE